MQKKNSDKTAIILGRFQGPFIHEGYKALLRYAAENYKNTVILLGVSPRPISEVDPLPTSIREEVIRTFYRNELISHELPSIFMIKDMREDVKWVNKLDGFIEMLGLSDETFEFVVGRDSFDSYYKPLGKYPNNFHVIDTVGDYNSTAVRESCKKVMKYTDEEAEIYAQGIVWATQQSYARTDLTVDIAIMKDDMILLGRKPDETKWRLPGGFFDLSLDATTESAAIREAYEETNIQLSLADCTHIKTLPVYDWRYRKGRDKVVTSLFLARHSKGISEPLDHAIEYRFKDMKASDDLAEIKLVNFKELYDNDWDSIVEGHIPLMQLIVEHLCQPTI